MNSTQIRNTFLEYFRGKGHVVVPSAPIVVKNDPTLMFTNAGMNQFKDYFLGHASADDKRVSDTQKCLRVSGKHNDLEEVGRDSYHHTMFEMLGNWSFGDYFKKEAIFYAWDLLTNVYKLNKDDIYITVFEGDKIDQTSADEEAVNYWKEHVSEDRILYFDKKDNFWEMGDTGPCGPCSEIHIDIRSDEEKKLKPGKELVNMDHPQVIEIWNLVFIQYNRKADGKLEELPAKHIDTGMGYERLCMVVQGKQSNYDSDLFTPYIKRLEKETGIKYTFDYSGDSMTDISMRVITDHLRAVSFTIADGEMPSNSGAGYVIRRILRRAVRYGYSFLNLKKPFIHNMVPLLAEQFKDVFPELLGQVEFISKVIEEEEKSFLRTLEDGLKRLDALKIDDGSLSGKDAFELYDTYGFPFDLTRLVAEEKGWRVDEKGFEQALQEQKQRSRADASKEASDWVVVNEGNATDFLGFDETSVENANVLKYRIVKEKGTAFNQLVLDKTPFYAEGGGQIGDTGSLLFGEEKIEVLDTKKENNLIIHYVNKLPENINKPVICKIDIHRRQMTENNHSATHLMHAALRMVLGTHVQQKGSLVKGELLRFDFSHYSKLSDEEIRNIENIVNEKIRANIPLEEKRSIPIEEAQEAGAMMLFGEKYGDSVRMITFDESYSRELCGGCHVDNTGQIGFFKIISETGIAAGVRRITAITSEAAEKHIFDEFAKVEAISELLNNPKDLVKTISDLSDENKKLKKEIEKLQSSKAGDIQKDLKNNVQVVNGINVLTAKINLADGKAAKTLVFNLEKEIGNAVVLIGNVVNDKPQLLLKISEDLIESKGLNAGTIIREIAKEINGGGGGQAFFATAGGSKAEGIDAALEKVLTFINA
ncbi:MAG: alanine--tRNA ligase [Saprospiraceae bacterium]|nr:alanine--tRNA ligase [Saprospiraceae bacterium]